MSVLKISIMASSELGLVKSEPHRNKICCRILFIFNSRIYELIYLKRIRLFWKRKINAQPWKSLAISNIIYILEQYIDTSVDSAKINERNVVKGIPNGHNHIIKCISSIFLCILRYDPTNLKIKLHTTFILSTFHSKFIFNLK